MKKILLLSSAYTGHGHKSICDSLCEQFAVSGDVSVRVVECFALLGRSGVRISKMYGSITRQAEDLWELIFDISSYSPQTINKFVADGIHDNLMKELYSFSPDLIVSVHPQFNGCVLHWLEHYKISIPFITLLADLWSIHPAWCDKRATAILCPTEESLETCVSFGMPRDILKRVEFPTRKRFVDAAKENVRPDWDGQRTLSLLMMSGGEGSGNLAKISKQLLDRFSCNVTIICGRNVKMRRALERSLKHRYCERVDILGFCENVQELMLASDVILLRASPNTMYEAIVCNVPMIATGALPGQEAMNPTFITKHNLGVDGSDKDSIGSIVADLLAKNGLKLKAIRQSQRGFVCYDAAKDIADYLMKMAVPKTVAIPSIPHRHPQILRASQAIKRARRMILHLRRGKKKTRSARAEP